MRIFVGTLYAGENELDECVDAINRQKGVTIEHVIFKNLGNKEAADTLYRTFMERSGEFDLLIKVDADMVLLDEHLFANISQKFREHDWLDLLEIRLHDFFSDQLIWGLNSFRSTVKWKPAQENLFIDDFPPVPNDRRIGSWEEVEPAGIHCKNPSPLQAFHYGVHKGLKVLQLGISEKEMSKTHASWEKIERTYDHYKRKRDIRLGYAVLGAELALKGNFQADHLDYSNPYMKQVFHRYANYTIPQIQSEIYRLRLTNWKFLTSRCRLKMVSFFQLNRVKRKLGKKFGWSVPGIPREEGS